MLWIPALPLLAALAGVLLTPRLRPNPERLATLCLQLGVGAPLLAFLMMLSATGGLFAASAPNHLAETTTTWLSIGRTTALHLNLSLDHLAATAMATLFVITLCTQLTAADRAQQLLRISAALGAALLLLLGESLLVIALGWHLLGAVSLSAGHRPSPARLRAFALGDAALWLTLGGLTYAAGAPNLGQIQRAALTGPGSRFAHLDLCGIPLAPWIALCLALALLLRLFASPLPDQDQDQDQDQDRNPAHATGSAIPDPSLRPLLHGAIAPIVGVYLLLRLSSVLAIDTSALSLLTALGSGLALIACARALTSTSAQAAFLWVGRAQFGLVILGIGVRAWVPALVLALVLAASQCGLQIAASSRPEGGDHPPWTRLGTALNALGAAAVTPIGALPPIALIAAAAWARRGATALAAPAIVLVSGLLALVIARGLQQSSKAKAQKAAVRPPEEPLLALATVSLGLFALALGVLCLPTLTGGLTAGAALAQDPWTVLLQPALRLAQVLAPSAPQDQGVLSGLTALILVAAWLGTAVGRRIPARATRRPRPAALARLFRGIWAIPGGLLLGFEGLLQGLRRRIYLRLWLSQGRARSQVVLALLGGIAAALGVVYCNPSVVVIGPTAVHSVDLGGINPLISAPKRTRDAQARKNNPANQTATNFLGPANAIDPAEPTPPATTTRVTESRAALSPGTAASIANGKPDLPPSSVKTPHPATESTNSARAVESSPALPPRAPDLPSPVKMPPPATASADSARVAESSPALSPGAAASVATVASPPALPAGSIGEKTSR